MPLITKPFTKAADMMVSKQSVFPDQIQDCAWTRRVWGACPPMKCPHDSTTLMAKQPFRRFIRGQAPDAPRVRHVRRTHIVEFARIAVFRNTTLVEFVCTALVFAFVIASKGLAAEPYAFPSNNKMGAMTRARLLLSVEGKLKIESAKEKPYEPPIQVTAKHYYDEKITELSESQLPSQTIRYYYNAEAQIDIDQKSAQSELDKHKRYVAQDLNGHALFYSPTGPMTREEIELINVPGNTTVLSQLLPAQPVHVGDSWSHEATVLARWLGLDDVGHSEVSSKLLSVKDDLANLNLNGHLSGVVNGVDTEIELVAKYRYEFKKKQITWLVMDVKEQRSVGHAQPGFEVVARLQLRTAPIRNNKAFEERRLAAIQFSENPASIPLQFQSHVGGFRLILDRRWYVMFDEDNSTVFRFIDDGDLIAQCNISRLPDVDKGGKHDLEVFQRDIQKGLGEHFGEFVEVEQGSLQSGTQMMRVVATGVVKQLPIRWIYYHLTEPTGRRAACVFTVETGLDKRFAAADRLLVKSLGFTASRAASQSPTPAIESTTDKPQAAQASRKKSQRR